MMTYVSEMFSWYAGSLEADTYFCPERHGMYFGGFGMKTAQAMRKQNYSSSTVPAVFSCAPSCSKKTALPMLTY